MITRRRPVLWTVWLAVVLLGMIAPSAAAAQDADAQRALLDRYCVTCHNDRLQTGNLSLERADVADPAADPALWEGVVRKLRAGAMPPQPRPRPDATAYAAVINHLESALDRAAAASPDPGRTPTFRRLSRTEYQNAIHDLLDLDVDVTAILPRDDVTLGFDNVNAGGLSPTLMERYLAASQKVSELAVGSRLPAPGSRVVIIPPDRTQERHVDGLPFGTRGGTIVDHTFPADGEVRDSGPPPAQPERERRGAERAAMTSRSRSTASGSISSRCTRARTCCCRRMPRTTPTPASTIT